MVELTRQLEPDEEFYDNMKQRYQRVEELMSGSEKYKVAQIWRTSELSPNTSSGKQNVNDAVVLLHTAVSERDLPTVVADTLEERTEIDRAHPGVSVEIEGLKMHIVPTKFAAQGTITTGSSDYPYFSEIVGRGKLFRQTSRLLQHWQYQQDLIPSQSALLPFEIEVTLAHIFGEEEPASVRQAFSLFMEFAIKERFAQQLNIFDRHNNILLYHDFKIPQKQELLNATKKAKEYSQTELISLLQ